MRHLLVAALSIAALAAHAQAPPRLKLYSAGRGSAFLPYAERLASVLTSEGISVTVVETNGSIENMGHLNEEADAIATVFLGSAVEGYTASANWTDGAKYTNVRALFPMYETSFQAVALASSGIRSLRDLRGKRVGVGPEGGPAMLYFNGISTAAGLQAHAVPGQPAELSAALLRNEIDTLWQGAIPPIPTLLQVLDGAPATVFGLTMQEQDLALNRFPYLTRATVPAHTYPAQPVALRTIGAWNFVYSNKALPAEIAEAVTRVALAHGDQLAPGTRPANAVSNTVVPFHDGALRYYRGAGIGVRR
jgi:hypothetical protein